MTVVGRFLKGVHFSVTLFNVGSVGAFMLMALVQIMGQGSCIPPCGFTRFYRGLFISLSFSVSVKINQSIKSIKIVVGNKTTYNCVKLKFKG